MADPELDLPLPGCLNSQARSWCFYQASPLCHLLSLHPRRSTVPHRVSPKSSLSVSQRPLLRGTGRWDAPLRGEQVAVSTFSD